MPIAYPFIAALAAYLAGSIAFAVAVSRALGLAYPPDLADFAAMNEVWEAWVVPGPATARATVSARLAKPEW